MKYTTGMNSLAKTSNISDLQKLESIKKLNDRKYRVSLADAVQEQDSQLLWVYLVDFLKTEKPSIKQSTLDAYKINVERFLNYAFNAAGLNLLKTSYRQAVAYRDHLLEPVTVEAFKSKSVREGKKVKKVRVSDGTKEVKLSNASVSQNLATVKQFYKMLINNELIEVSQFALVKLEKQDKKSTIKHYSVEELKLMINSDLASDDLKTVILLGYHTGLRVSEMVNLKCEDIDLIQGTLTVTTSKSGRSNEAVNMHVQLKQHLADVKKDGCIDKVIAYDYRQDIYRDLKSLCKKLGITNKGVHGLRHASGMEMLKKGKGKNLQAVSSHLRHADLQTSTIYAHLSNEDIKADVEMMESL